MIIVTGRNAKRFGDISYTYIIFVLNIGQFITQTSIEKFKADHYPVYFFFVILFICFVTFACIYALVGSRVLTIILTPPEYDVVNTNKYDLKDFVPLKPMGRYRSLIKYIKELTSISSSKREFSKANNESNKELTSSSFSKSEFSKTNNESSNNFNILSDNGACKI